MSTTTRITEHTYVVTATTDVLPVIRPGILPDNNPTQLEKLISTPDNFARWLLNQPDSWFVGTAQADNSCPIATWLRNSGYPDAHVGYQVIWDDPNNIELIMEDWAQNFVNCIDKTYGEEQKITAGSARRVLQFVTEANRS